MRNGRTNPTCLVRQGHVGLEMKTPRVNACIDKRNSERTPETPHVLSEQRTPQISTERTVTTHVKFRLDDARFDGQQNPMCQCEHIP